MNSIQSRTTTGFKRFIALGLLGAAALGLSATAQARSDVYWSVGIGGPGVSVGVGSGAPHYRPQPVYAPPPVYVAPQPVYVAPPVYYHPPPRVVYQPAPVYYVPAGPRGRYREDWRHGHKHHGHGHRHGHHHGHGR
ncbi:hypothetical protein [Ottowia thiooxydans]|uniref:hypothetical protein n=1 Tax=Ottowia thiooxydans TaxID=219182 RepID=UPI0012EBC777|nr:hypothetical protein [Ottowia thiooxydans]